MQASVQEIRLAAYYAGFLKSNKQQEVEIEDDVVRITSTDPKKVSILNTIRRRCLPLSTRWRRPRTPPKALQRRPRPSSL